MLDWARGGLGPKEWISGVIRWIRFGFGFNNNQGPFVCSNKYQGPIL